MRPPPDLAPNKVADLVRDAHVLGPFLSEVQRDERVLRGQHQIRAWEYAMTLRTIGLWAEQVKADQPLHFLDVGGAGSGFWWLLGVRTSKPIILVDPACAVPPSTNGDHGFFPCTIEEYARANPTARFDVITCLSVIEHVPDLRPFFHALHTLLKPGGLLVLTADYWDQEGPDTAHFHWMRERIYTKPRIQRLLADLHLQGFERFGHTDWTYAGPVVHAGDPTQGYSVCSLAVTKGTTR